MSSLRVLLLADLDRLDQFGKVSNNRAQFIQALIDHQVSSIRLEGRRNDYFRPGMKLRDLLSELVDRFDFRPQIIVHFLIGPGAGDLAEQLVVSEINQVAILKCLWVEDIQYYQLYSQLIRQHGFQAVMLQYRNQLMVKRYLKLMPEMIICCLETFIDSGMFSPAEGVEKLYDLVCYGYLDSCYPFRTRMFQLLDQHRDRFKIRFIQHPGYHQLEEKKVIAGDDLVREIRQAKMCLCTRSEYDLFLKKYLETAFCGTVICGDVPTDYHRLLRGRMVAIGMEMTDQQILDRIQQALDQFEQIQSKADQLTSLLRSKYNYPAGVNYFFHLCGQLVQVYYHQLNRKG